MKYFPIILAALFIFLIAGMYQHNRDIRQLQDLYNEVNGELTYLHNIVEDKADSFDTKAYQCKVTFYNATVEQCDDTPFQTACGMDIDPNDPGKHHYIGLSQDLAEEFYCGERVRLENAGKWNGYYTVADVGNPRLVRTVDILIGKRTVASTIPKALIIKLD